MEKFEKKTKNFRHSTTLKVKVDILGNRGVIFRPTFIRSSHKLTEVKNHGKTLKSKSLLFLFLYFYHVKAEIPVPIGTLGVTAYGLLNNRLGE